jgi:hypothetical protein
MQTRPPFTVRHGKSLVEALIEAVRELQTTEPNTEYHFACSFIISPAPADGTPITDSEVLSWLDALKGALSKFRAAEPAIVNVDILPVSKTKLALEAHVDRVFKTVLELDAPKSIVTPAEALQEARAAKGK